MKNQNETRIRVPEMVENPLGGEPLQVNFCKSPTCANFGVPARTIPVKSGPSEDRDDCYTVVSTANGNAPAILCKLCGQKPIVKSNEGVAEEVSRISSYIREGVCCPNEQCTNHEVDFDLYPDAYLKNGRSSAGTQRLMCKYCKKVFSINRKTKFLDQHKISSIFLDIVNKSPIRRTLEKNELGHNGGKAYYSRLDHIRRRCLRFSSYFDQHLMNGDFDLGELVISSDHQEYTVNWSSSEDRRNTLIHAVSSVDNASGFIFGLHSAYDPNVDLREANDQMIENGEHRLPESYRRNARLWLFGDALNPNRGAGARAKITGREMLADRIESEYREAIRRVDTEDSESACKEPRRGALVHFPYTTYANFFVLERLLKGARHVMHCLDHESVLRAAVLTAFENRIRKGTVQAFYVSVNKSYTVPERRALKRQAEKEFREVNKRRFGRGETIENCVRALMLENIRNASKIGPWGDQWVQHPSPRMDEPEKAICWLTGRGPSISERTVNMFLSASMNGCDNTFQLVRRRINLLERPLLTSSSNRAGWHGYSPYNPAMVQKSLDIFRCYMNFCAIREKDNQTPAMRLGLVSRPYTVNEVLNLEFADTLKKAG